MLALEFLCGVICKKYDPHCMLLLRRHRVYVGTLISWWNWLIIWVDSTSAASMMGLTKTTNLSYDWMLQLLALTLVCTVSRHYDTCSSLSSCVQLDSGFVCACSCVGVCIMCVNYQIWKWGYGGHGGTGSEYYYQLWDCECSAVQWSPGNIIESCDDSMSACIFLWKLLCRSAAMTTLFLWYYKRKKA